MTVFRLVHSEARRRAALAVQQAPDGYVCRITEPLKSREQEEKYHAAIGEIASVFRLNGKRLDAETMKRLLVDQFKHETLNDEQLAPHWKAMGQIELMPSLDGHRVIALGTQTRRFPKSLAGAFITWLDAWAAEHLEETA